MYMLKYLFLIVIGILLYILLNRKDGFSIGAQIMTYYSTKYKSSYYYNPETRKTTWEPPDGWERGRRGGNDVEPFPEGPPPYVPLFIQGDSYEFTSQEVRKEEYGRVF